MTRAQAMRRIGRTGRHWGVLLAVLGIAGAVVMTKVGDASEDAAKPNAEPANDAALERARAEVKMLDELYKNAVISITERYRRGQPAIMVAQDVFAAMKKSGHHDARLVDATGIPMNEENLPKSEFEKRAVLKIQEGEPYYEEVLEADGRRVLNVATVVPAVHARCASCHAVEEGDLLGFLRYQIPIE